MDNHRALAEQLRQKVHPVTRDIDDYAPLLDYIGDARIVLIGEASHGTHEFYQVRAQLTQKLITEKGFTGVAVEADFPDANRVNRYVHGVGKDASPEDALGDFQRFPRWMWRNTEVVHFVRWLRAHNDAARRKVGFYGLDLYSLHSSIEAVLNYLEQVDPEAARRARYRYSCFDHYGEDPQTYGYAVNFGITEACENETVSQLVDLRESATRYMTRDGREAEDAFFSAEQNARLARNAERYYRTMFTGRVSSWNVRDEHMAETLDELIDYQEGRGDARIVVWAHNSHLGDARATYMHSIGELNLGQLVRERYGDACVNIGFTTYGGTVTAASHWDSPVERKRVRPGLPGSYEALFHQVDIPRFVLLTHETPELSESRLERAIGVIYRPDTERVSHYFDANMREQFDAVIHIDETRALEPLDRNPGWDAGALRE